jgi:hypothetical protein
MRLLGAGHGNILAVSLSPDAHPVPADGTVAVTERAGDLARAALIFGGVAVFWILFATLFEGFYRDDNVGGTIPVLMEVGRLLLQGQSPTHLYSLGGGVARISLVVSGVLDPLVIVPTLMLQGHPAVLANTIAALHLALFAAGGWFLGRRLGTPRWAALVGAIGLGSSGYFVVWAGNWLLGMLVPFAFLPWLAGGLIGVLDAESRRELIAMELVSALGIGGVFLSGMPFAGYYGGIVIVFLLVAHLADHGFRWRRTAVRIAPLGLLLVVIVIAVLLPQKAEYEFLGGRTNSPIHWVLFAVPAQSYLGLFLPTTSSVWRGPFYPDGMIATNLLMTVGIIPPWYLLGCVFRQPRVYRQSGALVLLLGMATMVLVLSPGSFGLESFFASLPLLNAFRWPFRALPAAHILVVVLFFYVAARMSQPTQFARTLMLIIGIGGTIAVFGYDLALATELQPVASWFSAAPLLDDPEEWSPGSLRVLQAGGYVANVCSGENVIHKKPRLYFYGNMGLLFRVKTVHAYQVPPPVAYSPLGMSIKGCCSRWAGVRELIERGPSAPLPPQRWEDPRGPRSFQEIVAKTHVSAVVVDPQMAAAVGYFSGSPAWKLLEARKRALLFVRR